MEFQTFEEMLEYDVNVKEAIIAEEVNQVMQTVYFPTGADQRSVSRSELIIELNMDVEERSIRKKTRHCWATMILYQVFEHRSYQSGKLKNLLGKRKDEDVVKALKGWSTSKSITLEQSKRSKEEGNHLEEVSLSTYILAMHELELVSVMFALQNFPSFWYEERMQASPIKEALRKENVVAYALWMGKFVFDIEKDLKNHEAKLGLIYSAAL
ncbi:hypothetical protein F2Q69_00029923 [Brassica cretica]|uniref:Uncharacterized protein n=1 Tax=Brassica cretica TaxID=69181 RepID=A0A8S9RZ67_BRACR|nr:hypothetical protein F2Q69_00029923 [Brassica cretica]